MELFSLSVINKYNSAISAQNKGKVGQSDTRWQNILLLPFLKLLSDNLHEFWAVEDRSLLSLSALKFCDLDCFRFRGFELASCVLQVCRF